MERMNRTVSALMLAGMIGLGSLGAGDPATQPATPKASPSAAVNNPAETGDANNPQNSTGRQGRRNRGSRNDAAGSGASSPLTGGSGSGMDKYAILKSRSIFVKGNQTTYNDNSAVRPRYTPTNDVVGKRSSMLVFNGVIVIGDEPNAMIEDQGSNTVTLLRVGDPIAAGHLSSITFDDITYEENGNQKRVELGQNLDGVTPTMAVAATPTPPSTQPGAPDGTAGAAPTGAAPASGGGSSSADEILAKMKAKRAAELGNK